MFLKPKLLSLFVLIVLITGLIGCTTVQDFRKMTPDERATRVCNRKPHIMRLVSQRESLQASVQSAREALSRGYRIHKQCKQVKVYGDTTTTCTEKETFSGSGQRSMVCKESKPESFVEECNETPVSINPDNERLNIQGWLLDLEELQERFAREWDECYQYIRSLSPDEAYKHY